MKCAICLYVEDQLQADAVTIINGTAVCDRHMHYLDTAEPFMAALAKAKRAQDWAENNGVIDRVKQEVTQAPQGAPRNVYTDGSCRGNPGAGGWGWAVESGPYASGSAPNTTNQRMELQAVLEAVTNVEGPMRIVSDSKYVVDCFNFKWHEGWKRNGWKTTAKKPVANKDLWEPLIEAVLRRGDVTFGWVKGHNGDPMNELVDGLATEAARRQMGTSGILDRKVC